MVHESNLNILIYRTRIIQYCTRYTKSTLIYLTRYDLDVYGIYCRPIFTVRSTVYTVLYSVLVYIVRSTVNIIPLYTILPGTVRTIEQYSRERVYESISITVNKHTISSLCILCHTMINTRTLHRHDIRPTGVPVRLNMLFQEIQYGMPACQHASMLLWYIWPTLCTRTVGTR